MEVKKILLIVIEVMEVIINKIIEKNIKEKDLIQKEIQIGDIKVIIMVSEINMKKLKLIFLKLNIL